MTLTHATSARAFAAPRRITFSQRITLWRSRRQLAALDDAALRDIGISSEDARREAQRGFWDAPASWYRH